MAIKKVKEYKGQSAEYWKIIRRTVSELDNSTVFVLALYFNRASSKANVHNLLESQEVRIAGELLTKAECYVAAKEPRLDEHGNNINWFSDGEDVFEAPKT